MKFITAIFAAATLAACGQTSEAPTVPVDQPVVEQSREAFLAECLAQQAANEVLGEACVCAIEAASGGQCSGDGLIDIGINKDVIDATSSKTTEVVVSEDAGLEDPK